MSWVRLCVASPGIWCHSDPREDDAECDLSSSGHKPTKRSHPWQKSLSIVTAITARSALEVTICSMGWDHLSPKPLCPACGRPMGLTRTIAASPGYGELHTYGCRECGGWGTEGSSPSDQLRDTPFVRKSPSVG